MGTVEFPQIETALIDGDVAVRQHSAGHPPGPNGPTFLKFTEHYFATPASTADSQTAHKGDEH
jgi:hypothetical protein